MISEVRDRVLMKGVGDAASHGTSTLPRVSARGRAPLLAVEDLDRPARLHAIVPGGDDALAGRQALLHQRLAVLDPADLEVAQLGLARRE